MNERNNSGNHNSGYCNSGNWNSGNRNSGYCNSGNWNSGDWNSGHRNSGYCNSGNWNSGYYNSGHRNSGYYNSGNWNSGYFNTNTPKVRIFNKETEILREDINFPEYFYFNLNKWISEEDLTDKQKEEHPKYNVLGGWLISYDYKEAFIQSFKEKCNKEQAEQTINLPNFDYEIFEEITGITKEMLEEKLGYTKSYNPKEIIIKGAKYKLVE